MGGDSKPEQPGKDQIKAKRAMSEHRCKNCNKLLLTHKMIGIVEVKCPKCGTLNQVTETAPLTIN